MIGKRFLFPVASILFLSMPAIADEKAAGQKINLCIRNLGDHRFATREQAAQDLIRLGQPALSALKAAVASRDEEVRRRAESIVRLIEARLENEALIRAPKIRLTFAAVPLDEAVAELNRKTGLTYALDQKAITNPKQPITLDTGDVPYWEAVERFLTAAELVENPTPAPAMAPDAALRQQRLRRGPYGQAPVSPVDNRVLLIKSKAPVSADTASLIRVKVLPASVAGAGATKGTNQINFMLDVTPSPALTWQGLASVEVRRAVDDHDTTLAQSHLHSDSSSQTAMNDMQAFGGGRAMIINGGQMVFIGGGNIVFNEGWDAPPVIGHPRHIRVTLLAEEHSSKMLKELTGVVTGRILTPPATLLTIDNLLTVSLKDTIQAGQYQVQITDRQTEKAGYVHLHFSLSAPFENSAAANNFQFNGGFQMEGFGNGGQPTISIQDATGKVINNVAMNLMAQNFNGQTQILDYMAVIPTQGYKSDSLKFLVTGRKCASVDVPFILKNVPLP